MLKIPHAESQVVDDVITLLEQEFGNDGPLTINREKVHEYFGMRLDFSTPGKTIVSMESYINPMLDSMPDYMIDVGANPAAP
jgi:hypothetical protein